MVEFVPFAGFVPVLGNGESIGDRIAPSHAAEGAAGDFRDHRLYVAGSVSGNGGCRDCSRELSETIINGDLAQDPESFYAYRRTIDGRKIVGIIGALRLEAFGEGRVMPLDSTSSKMRNDRLALLRDVRADAEPVLGIVRSVAGFFRDGMPEGAEPVFEHVDSEGAVHELFRITDEGIASMITAEMANQKVLIAGGQAEYEAALMHSSENPDSLACAYVMAMLVASDDAKQMARPVHRLLKAGDIGETGAIKKIMKNVDAVLFDSADDAIGEMGGHAFCIVFRSGRGMVADQKPSGSAPQPRLDVSIAQDAVINGVYKADEGKSKITYCDDAAEAIELVRSGGLDLAVLFNEPDLDRIWDVASSGKKAPKRSLSFGPPFPSGFVYRMR